MIGFVSVGELVERIPDGASLLIGGFMGVGTPTQLIDGLVEAKKRNLTVIANDTAKPNLGIGRLIRAKLVKKAIVSHIGLNPETQRQMVDGELDVQLVPQGTLVECIRAGGMGLGGVITRTGVGTNLERADNTIVIRETKYLLELPIRADFALIAANRADQFGNLEYSLTAENFNPVMALAADTVIAEAQRIVSVGVIPPDSVKTPGPLVDYLISNNRDSYVA